ncbi:MAG: histidine kinase [Bacteroidales bacterium]|nr:histidine kinase [Bacteroidales bacterium]MDD4673420.1 histidine kinase [Bacteroidales bacterium]
MELQVALMFSAAVQLVAFIITISLIPKTKFSVAWISISIGFFLMAIRRLIEAYSFINNTPVDNVSELNSWIAVVISVAMLLSSIYIRKIFKVLNSIHQFRKESEAKLLTAIISTEERERKHFSKELHDGLGPVLSSAKMTISAISKESIEAKNVQLLEKVEGLVDNAILTTKEISNHLTPHLLERYGLKKAIETFIRNTTVGESVKINISSDIKKQRYKENIEVMLFRICCELINNTQKHAFATKISIILTDNASSLELKYEDNGVGFDSRYEKYGMGLTNIVSRVKSINGSIELFSAPRNGFYACIKLPL